MNNWERWIERVRSDLLAIDGTGLGPEAAQFLDIYKSHKPAIVTLPDWNAFRWSLPSLRGRCGHHRVQVQTGRNADPDYEIHSGSHRAIMAFWEFVDLVVREDGNSVYMTAQNRDSNGGLSQELAKDFLPMPVWLTDQPEQAFFWIGKDTITPTHHDVTNNLMAQIMGHKIVRVVAPDQCHKVDHRSGVHTNIGWLTEALAASRGIAYTDYHLHPGQALHLPVGHWHCVKSVGISITAVFTNYRWRNDASATFHAMTST